MAYLHFDAEDYLDKVSTSDLLAEINRRHIQTARDGVEGTPYGNIVEELRTAYTARDDMHFEVLLSRMMPLDEIERAAREQAFSRAHIGGGVRQ